MIQRREIIIGDLGVCLEMIVLFNKLVVLIAGFLRLRGGVLIVA